MGPGELDSMPTTYLSWELPRLDLSAQLDATGKGEAAAAAAGCLKTRRISGEHAIVYTPIATTGTGDVVGSRVLPDIDP